MNTLRELIMQEIETTLAGVSGLSGVSIHRSLDDLLDEGNLPAIAFAWINDEISESRGQIDQHKLTVEFRSAARGESAESTADSNVALAVKAVIESKSLNGKAKMPVLGSGFRDGSVQGGPGTKISQFVTIQYTSKTGSLTAAAG